MDPSSSAAHSSLPVHTSSRFSYLTRALFFASLVLLPWTWFPPFPWLHEHAQWSDVLFAATVAAWIVERLRHCDWPRPRPLHAALAVYFILACLSSLFAPDFPANAPKLLGIAELCALAFICSDLVSRPGGSPIIARAIEITSIATALAAIGGLLLFYAGTTSRLIGIYGELEASHWYARVQAGTYNPNLLASFCIFASAIVAQRDGELPTWLRRVAMAALWITVGLTFSRGILGFVLAAVIRNARTPRRKAIAVSVAIVFTCLLVSATLWKPLINPSRPLETRFTSEPTSRRQAITSSLTTLIAHPLLGSGLGTSPGIFRGLPFDAHCTPLNIAATLGLPALMVFSALNAMAWRSRKRPTDLAIWGGLAGLALDGLAQDVEEFRHLWVMIGLASARAVKQSVNGTK